MGGRGSVGDHGCGARGEYGESRTGLDLPYGQEQSGRGGHTGCGTYGGLNEPTLPVRPRRSRSKRPSLMDQQLRLEYG